MKIKSKINPLIFSLLLALVLSLCSCSTNIRSKQNIQLYLPLLSGSMSSVYVAWETMSLENIPLMPTPLLDAKDIKSYDNGKVVTNKDFAIVEGHGIFTGLLADERKGSTLEFEYQDKQYKIDGNSTEIFTNYYIHGICVVVKGNQIFFVKQWEHTRENITDREYNSGPIGIPYVIVVNGERKQLGIIKVAEGEFEVPEMFDSWCYMGFPEGLPNLVPTGKELIKED